MSFTTYIVPLSRVEPVRAHLIADGKVEGVHFVIKTRAANGQLDQVRW